MPLRPLRPGDPRVLGAYPLLGVLGEGGMGSVYQARDAGGTLVAIKVIRAEFAAAPEFRARFRSEVSRARQVPPFCTAAVLDADPEHRTPYLVVEYVDGPDLAQVIAERGPLTGGSLHSVAVGVATALVAIHGAGVVHRDLKPTNVLFALGSPKVIDFGIARALESTSEHTRTGQIVGTVAYMAPERLDGPLTGHATPAVDVFAWGAVVAYAGTGRIPFPGESTTGIAVRILTGEPDLRGLTGSLRTIVEKALAKNPADRPTAPELLEMLLAAEKTPVAPITETMTTTGGTRRGARGAVVLGAAALAVALASAAAVAAWTGAGQQETSSSAPSGPADVLLPDIGTPGPTQSAPPKQTVVPKTPQLVISDYLMEPGLWQEGHNGRGNCVFDGEFMVLSGQNGVRCPGPGTVVAGDQTIWINVGGLAGDVCGRVYFWYQPAGTYVVESCKNHIELVSVTNSSRWKRLDKAEKVWEDQFPRRLSITIKDAAVVVAIDGKDTLTSPLNEPELEPAGTVELASGVYGEEEGSHALFWHIEVYDS